MTQHRLFLALDIDDATREALVEAGEILAAAAGRSVRWVAPENLHVTLKFIGETPSSLLPELIEAVSQAALTFPPVDFEVRGVLAIPPVGRVLKMLWAEVVEPSGRLAAMAAHFEDILTPLGVAPERRLYQPHITLARVRYLNRPEPLRKRVAAMAARTFGQVTADRMVLYESQLDRSGPIYTPMTDFPLAADPNWSE